MGFPKVEAHLEGAALHPLYSHYIMQGGSASEKIAIDHVHLSGRIARARCRFLEHYVSPTDKSTFHLSAQRGIDFITQVACIQVLYLNGMREKTTEMWLTNYSVTCLRAQRDPQDIQIELELIGRTISPPDGEREQARSFYKWKFDVGGGGWFGVLQACFGFEDRMNSFPAWQGAEAPQLSRKTG